MSCLFRDVTRQADASLSQCGPSDATAENPNGSESWLNCGIDAGGWNPPHVTLADLKYKTLTADGPFAPCAPYIGKFEQYGNQYGSELALCSVHETRG